ncbi:uncharacterized protein PG998_006076 [Apiospora kogelbergensis]|uniref:uncharacterized protein n=1 Tax=Apiospora kogelbergensis TaxID=1337665 RepID=UPI0031302675
MSQKGQYDMPSYGLSGSAQTLEQDVPKTVNRGIEKWYYLFRRGWTLEVLSSGFSLASLLAMIILLARIHETPLSSWTASISPNAMIAVLSTASRASLLLPVTESLSQLKWLHLAAKHESNFQDLQLFDDASRGPLGSLTLLLSIRTSSIMPYIGSIITLTALAFEPFSQQLLSFIQTQTQQPDTQSSVQRSLVYDNHFESTRPSAIKLSRMLALTRPFCQKTISNYNHKPETLRDTSLRAAVVNSIFGKPITPPFSCPGEQCDFPSFLSLGVCNSCREVTSQIEPRLVNTAPPYQRWQFTTLNNKSFVTANSYTNTHPVFLDHTRVNTTVYTQSEDSSGISVVLIKFPYFDDDDTEKHQWVQNLEAHECFMYLCGQIYENWTMTNGTLNPGMVRTTKLTNYNRPSKDSLTELTSVNGNLPGNASLLVNVADLASIFLTLVEMFAGYSDGLLNHGLDSALGESWYESAFYDSPDLTDTIANMTKSMSYRLMSGPNATVLHGNVYHRPTYIVVQWAWLALPMVLELSACGFLATVMIITKRAQHLIWKSSLLPLLLTDDSYPVFDPVRKPMWTRTQLRARRGTIVNHLTH